jgi:hypothetical protein
MSYLNSPAVAVLGAGPYGLSIAAHLRSRGVEFRIFGVPMQGWVNMPKGMYLKSEGFASNLFDPAANYSLRQYCAGESLQYAQYGSPVSLDVFTRYGLWFQQQLVPTVENAAVTALDRSSSSAGFELRLTTGEALCARKVIVATGISHTAYVPPALRALPSDIMSHSSSHSDLSGFKGRDVTVIGGGQSALETAALLHEAGSKTCLVVRGPSVRWNETPTLGCRSVYDRVRRPMSALGAGLGPWLYSNTPMLFFRLPRRTRIARVKKAYGPAGAWWLRHRVLDRVPILSGHAVRAVETAPNGVILHLEAPDGKLRDVTTDHVIAATGYRFTLGALPFLSERLLSQVRSVIQTPLLSPHFESSVSGLYFTGLASANQFGPAMRFLHGAEFTARQVSRHIVAGENRSQLPLPATAISSRSAGQA